MTSHSHHLSLSLGDSSDVLLATKSQLARLGLPVGDASSPVFDHQFDSVLRSFQQARGLMCDGVLGPETFAQIELARFRLGDRVLRFDPVLPMRGDDVAELQKKLSRLGLYTRRIDFVFAEHTEAAVREAQQGLGLRTDGIAGPATLNGLNAISRRGSGGNLYALQEQARVTASGPSLAGRVFVIEAATATHDFTTIRCSKDLAELESQLSTDIARRLEGRLSALGAATVSLTGDHQKHLLADELGASAMITINHDVSASPKANGAATYFFGRADEPSVNSPMGSSLATLIQKELRARTKFLDCGTHAKTWESLRRLNTPKVHVIPGYLSNPRDREALMLADVRDRIAESIAVSLQRLYLREDSDPPTGTLDLSAFRAQRESES